MCLPSLYVKVRFNVQGSLYSSCTLIWLCEELRLERSVESTTITIGTPVVLTSPTLRGVEVIEFIPFDYSTGVL